MKFKGWTYIIFSGILLVAGVVLVVLQWARSADFSLFGYPYDIRIVGDRLQGGVNTALLMLLSAVGGLKARWLVKVLLRGVGHLRKAGKAEKLAEAAAKKVAT